MYMYTNVQWGVQNLGRFERHASPYYTMVLSTSCTLFTNICVKLTWHHTFSKFLKISGRRENPRASPLSMKPWIHRHTCTCTPGNKNIHVHMQYSCTCTIDKYTCTHAILMYMYYCTYTNVHVHMQYSCTCIIDKYTCTHALLMYMYYWQIYIYMQY